MIDESRHAAVRVQLEVLLTLVLALPPVWPFQLVLEAKFIQQEDGLPVRWYRSIELQEQLKGRRQRRTIRWGHLHGNRA